MPSARELVQKIVLDPHSLMHLGLDVTHYMCDISCCFPSKCFCEFCVPESQFASKLADAVQTGVVAILVMQTKEPCVLDVHTPLPITK